MQKDREYRTRRHAQMRANHVAHGQDVNRRRRPRSLVQRLARRWRRLLRLYGLSQQDYETLLARQGGGCGTCKETARPLVVDRSRATGRVRGLLCRRCKAVLTCFNEDPDVLARAVAFREKAVPADKP